VRDCLAVVKAWLSSSGHMNSFLELSRGRRGANSPVMMDVFTDSWLTRPKKARRSVQFVGVGKFEIASVMDLSTQYPSADKVNLAKLTSD